jgi:hypothetical protein
MANEAEIKATELKAILAQYEVADAQVEAAHQAVKDTEAARSEIVKRLALCIAPDKNFGWGGRDITIVVRPHKDNSGDTYFLRGKSAKKNGMIKV